MSTPGKSRTILLDLLLAALLVAVCAALVIPARDSWFHQDDFKNLRWIMEFGDRPWSAFTDRQAMHGHVRPMVSVALWAVTPSHGDPFTRQLALLLGLQAMALAGAGALTLRLGGTRRQALLAMLFATSLHGFEVLGHWVAWVCSAGQLAFGFWALVLWDRALERPRSAPWALPSALLFAVVAGLFKEPGWVVLPIAALALALRRDGSRLFRAFGSLGFLTIGVAGFAWAWHPDNATRYLSVDGNLTDRTVQGLLELPAAALDGWPRWTLGDPSAMPGLPVLLLTGLLATDLASGWLAWGLWLVAAGAASFSASAASVVVFVMSGLVVLRRASAPPVGLVLFLLENALSIPISIRNEVQTLGGGMGLAIYAALSLPRLFTAPTPRLLRVIAGAALATWAVRTGVGALPGARTKMAGDALVQRERLHGFASLVAVMGPSEAVALPPARPSDELLPMTGLIERAKLARPASIVVGDSLLLNPPPGAFERSIVALSRLGPGSLPHLGLTVTAGKDLPREGLALDLAPGFYALGVAPSGPTGNTLGMSVHAMDKCGNTWLARTPSIDIPIALTVLELHEGCAPLQAGWSGDPSQEGLFVLAPLVPDAPFGLDRGALTEHHLDVRVQPTQDLEKPKEERGSTNSRTNPR